MRILTISGLGLLLLALGAGAEDSDAGLGYSSGLGGDVPNSAVVLPQAPAANVPRGVRPVIVLPPESLQPHTLVVPLPGEQAPPVILRRDSIEAVPVIQPPLPASKVAPAGTKPSTKTKPLAPVVY